MSGLKLPIAMDTAFDNFSTKIILKMTYKKVCQYWNPCAHSIQTKEMSLYLPGHSRFEFRCYWTRPSHFSRERLVFPFPLDQALRLVDTDGGVCELPATDVAKHELGLSYLGRVRRLWTESGAVIRSGNAGGATSVHGVRLLTASHGRRCAGTLRHGLWRVPVTRPFMDGHPVWVERSAAVSARHEIRRCRSRGCFIPSFQGGTTAQILWLPR